MILKHFTLFQVEMVILIVTANIGNIEVGIFQTKLGGVARLTLILLQ